MAELPNDFLGDEPRVVPLRDLTHRDASARNAGTPAMYRVAILDQAADLRDCGHCLDYIELRASPWANPRARYCFVMARPETVTSVLCAKRIP
jgi:hypothetical protein